MGLLHKEKLSDFSVLGPPQILVVGILMFVLHCKSLKGDSKNKRFLERLKCCLYNYFALKGLIIIKMTSDHCNREGCVCAVQRLKASNLFIVVAAELWGLELLCYPCLPML